MVIIVFKSFKIIHGRLLSPGFVMMFLLVSNFPFVLELRLAVGQRLGAHVGKGRLCASDSFP